MLARSPLAPTHGAVAANARALTGVHVLGRGGFNEPRAVTVAGNHVWVANFNGNSVTELDATTGTVVRSLSARRYGFRSPWAITATGNHVSVVSSDGDSVTEINATTGALVRVISGPAYQFGGPVAVAAGRGDHLWVVDEDRLRDRDRRNDRRACPCGGGGADSPVGCRRGRQPRVDHQLQP